MNHKPGPFLLTILDGWGHREQIANNAILQAKTPYWDRYWQQYPHTLIGGSGQDVGLPEGQMGNSEVGHLNIGAGRIVYQDFTRINQAIHTGEFFKHPQLNQTLKHVLDEQATLHIMGLLSPGGVHSHEQHMFAVIKHAASLGVQKIFVHAFLDGRDTPPQSAEQSIQALEAVLAECGKGAIASIAGRYYAMDRDNRWERVQPVYQMLTEAKANHHVESAEIALRTAYQRGETDEFVKPTLIGDAPAIAANDVVLFMNFRADRARQLSRAFLERTFQGFKRNVFLPNLGFVTLTQYAKDIQALCLYPPEQHKNVLGEVIATLGKKQLRIAETEKYAHVTFFFNGGIEHPFPGEDRILIPSPNVATYDLKPEMSAFELTEQLVDAIKSQSYEVIVCNFANPDMVGHTGNIEATIKAIETIDQCLGKIHEALSQVNGQALITADHGNAEFMYDEQTGQAHTAHTSNLVPLLYLGEQSFQFAENGLLSDIAPTMLSLMNIAQPAEMTGRALNEV